MSNISDFSNPYTTFQGALGNGGTVLPTDVAMSFRAHFPTSAALIFAFDARLSSLPSKRISEIHLATMPDGTRPHGLFVMELGYVDTWHFKR